MGRNLSMMTSKRRSIYGGSKAGWLLTEGITEGISHPTCLQHDQANLSHDEVTITSHGSYACI
jgi:hypothetical protein